MKEKGCFFILIFIEVEIRKGIYFMKAMKNLFALFFAVSLLLLTGCHTTPAGTGGTESTGGDVQPSGTAIPKDTIVGNGNTNFIHLPSRIIFHTGVSDGEAYHVYYSKSDGRAYVYCFDPLCDHSGGECLANPSYSDEEYGGDYYVGTIGADGKIDELKPIEIVW